MKPMKAEARAAARRRNPAMRAQHRAADQALFFETQTSAHGAAAGASARGCDWFYCSIRGRSGGGSGLHVLEVS